MCPVYFVTIVSGLYSRGVMSESLAAFITPFYPPYLKGDIGALSEIPNPKPQWETQNPNI
jgi:hypothetical protein